MWFLSALTVGQDSMILSQCLISGYTKCVYNTDTTISNKVKTAISEDSVFATVIKGRYSAMC